MVVASATALLPASALAAAPEIVSLDFSSPPLTGKPALLTVRTASPVSSVVVSFGDGEDSLGESACRARVATAKSGTTEFQLGNVFSGNTAKVVTVTVGTGDCASAGETATQTLLVTPLGAAPLPAGTALPSPSGVLPALPTLPPVVTSPVSASASATCANADLEPSPTNLEQIRTATRCLMNVERSTRGLHKLRRGKLLGKAGLWQALDMLGHHYFDHKRPGGPTLIARLRKTGYHFTEAAENLGTATGQFATPREMMAAWMHSDGHRENILFRAFREVGVAAVPGFPLGSGGDGATYAVEFGIPKRVRRR